MTSSDVTEAVGELLYDLQMDSGVNHVPLHLLSQARDYDEATIEEALEELKSDGLVEENIQGYSVTEEYVVNR